MRHLLLAASAMTLMTLAKNTGTDGEKPTDPAPADDTSTSMRSVTISGATFELPAPYSEGHQLNAAEASVLNQTFLENVRNNAASKIKAAQEKAKEAGTEFSLDTPIGGEGEDKDKTLRQTIADYAANYKFGVRVSRTSEPADPVQREARSIAREAINAALKAQGVKRKDVDEEAYEAALVTHAATDAIQAEAKRRVEAMGSIGLEELGLTAKPTTDAG